MHLSVLLEIYVSVEMHPKKLEWPDQAGMNWNMVQGGKRG